MLWCTNRCEHVQFIYKYVATLHYWPMYCNMWCNMYMYMAFNIHEMLRKTKYENTTQQKDKATKHNSPKAVILVSCLRWDNHPLSRRLSYQLSYRGWTSKCTMKYLLSNTTVHTSAYSRFFNPDDNLIRSLTAFPIDSQWTASLLESKWKCICLKLCNLLTEKRMCYKYTIIPCVSALQEVYCIP